MAIGVNTGNAQNTTVTPAAYESLSKMSGNDAAKMKEVTSKAMEVLAGANLKVSKSDTAGTDGVAEKKTNGATSTPVLDNPDDAKAKEADLTKLISYLQLDNEERQTEMAKARIDMQKAGLDTEHDDRMRQIDDSIKKMKDAERASKISRIFGWIGAVLAVAAAAVLTVVTGGLAAGFAIAGAALAVTALTLNETGAMEKMVNALADRRVPHNKHLNHGGAARLQHWRHGRGLLRGGQRGGERHGHWCEGRSRYGQGGHHGVGYGEDHPEPRHHREHCGWRWIARIERRFNVHDLQVGGFKGRHLGTREVHDDAPAAS